MNDIIRRLRCYEKDGDVLIAEIELPPLDLAYLQYLFDISEDNPMYDAYQVHEKQKIELEKHIDQKINLLDYDYFLQ